VQFVLECRDPGKLQEPIRSRCLVQRIKQPCHAVLEEWIRSRYASIDIPSIFEYLRPDEYSYRRVQHCIFLQIQEPATWNHVCAKRREELAAAEDLKAELIPTYQAKAFHPRLLLEAALKKHPELLEPYGECLELAGSLWAFLGYAALR
jgi:DNA polymerase III delta prime subunit